jgi:hypothetical protein
MLIFHQCICQQIACLVNNGTALCRFLQRHKYKYTDLLAFSATDPFLTFVVDGALRRMSFLFNFVFMLRWRCTIGPADACLLYKKIMTVF